jgi:hypothetical protein
MIDIRCIFKLNHLRRRVSTAAVDERLATGDFFLFQFFIAIMDAISGILTALAHALKTVENVVASRLTSHLPGRRYLVKKRLLIEPLKPPLAIPHPIFTSTATQTTDSGENPQPLSIGVSKIIASPTT